jgi:hypothetical protein
MLKVPGASASTLAMTVNESRVELGVHGGARRRRVEALPVEEQADRASVGAHPRRDDDGMAVRVAARCDPRGAVAGELDREAGHEPARTASVGVHEQERLLGLGREPPAQADVAVLHGDVEAGEVGGRQVRLLGASRAAPGLIV